MSIDKHCFSAAGTCLYLWKDSGNSVVRINVDSEIDLRSSRSGIVLPNSGCPHSPADIYGDVGVFGGTNRYAVLSRNDVSLDMTVKRKANS